MLCGLDHHFICEFGGQRSALLLLWLSLCTFSCYLVLLKEHLKISQLCKRALRRLAKGITELRWAILLAAGKGEAFIAEHCLGWNVAFLKIHQADNCLVLDIIDHLTQEV